MNGNQEMRIYEGYGQALPFADLTVAHRECSSRAKVYLDDCRECGEKIAIHCETCKVQVNGCTCTDTVLYGREYAVNAAALRPTGTAGQNRANRRAAQRKRDRKLWTPNQMHR